MYSGLFQSEGEAVAVYLYHGLPLGLFGFVYLLLYVCLFCFGLLEGEGACVDFEGEYLAFELFYFLLFELGVHLVLSDDVALAAPIDVLGEQLVELGVLDGGVVGVVGVYPQVDCAALC